VAREDRWVMDRMATKLSALFIQNVMKNETKNKFYKHMIQEKYFCRWAPSLGSLEATHQEVWGTEDYVWWKHWNRPTVFFGLYDLRDYVALAAHPGKKWVLWAGSDIRNLAGNFYETDGKLHKLSGAIPGFRDFIAKWLTHTNLEHWVENEAEKEALEKLGIRVTGVCPSYLGQTELPVKYRRQRYADAYISTGKGRQEEYGFGLVERIAGYLPWMNFHLYGDEWKTQWPNVIVHGRVPKEQMNEETSMMHIGLRFNEFDGFSEIMAKAILRGQYAVGRVAHPFVQSFTDEIDLIFKLNRIRKNKLPNFSAREWYRRNLNTFPWNVKMKECEIPKDNL